MGEVEAAVAAERFAERISQRRPYPLDDADPLCQEPADKRLRGSPLSFGSSGEVGDSIEFGGAASNGEAVIRGWTEAIVHTLHCCPSVEEAAHRCARVLTEF